MGVVQARCAGRCRTLPHPCAGLFTHLYGGRIRRLTRGVDHLFHRMNIHGRKTMKYIAARTPLAWRWVTLGMALSVAGALGIVNLASAHPAPDGPGMPGGPRAHGMGMGMGGGLGWAPGMPLLGGPMSERLLEDIQATPAQREQLNRIAEAARTDLRAKAEAARPDPGRLAELLAKPVVDEAAVEALRRQALQRHDETTRRLQVAMLEAAKVLTPEQRARIAERMKQHAARMADGAERPDHPERRGGPGADAPAPR
jgi:periplasmic protein CpxP/Spy